MIGRNLKHIDMKQQDLFQGYPFPKTNIQEILLTLILQGHVSIFDYAYLSGFRTRISELKLEHDIILERKTATRYNKFANKYTYSIHVLPKSEKEKAIQLYEKLNKN